MANIGIIAAAANGMLIGKIETLAVSLTIGLKPNENPNPRAPRFEIMALSSAKKWIRVGALFEHYSNSTGEAFLQGTLDDPSWKNSLSIACFRQDDDSYAVAWSRPRSRDNGFGSSQRQTEGGDMGGEVDGLGDSTAPGALNDEIPAFDGPAKGGRGKAKQEEAAA